MTASWRPDLAVQVAFNADPNSTSIPARWSDLSSTLFTSADGIKRGRQYELNTNLGSQPNINYIDRDEYLNPANTSSIYAPGVDVYRQTLIQAMWPNGGTGNLLNTGAQAVSYDPTFEAYTAGTTPTWVTAVGGALPVVGTTTPRTGTKDLTWAVAASRTIQGASWPLPCIPGRQYTASAYVRQTVSTPQQLSITDQNLVVDGFYRTTASGWGTADVGGAWSVTGGSAANYSTSAGVATMSNAATNTSHIATVGSSITDCDVYVQVTVPVVATGAPIDAQILTRYADASNHYYCGLRFETTGAVTLLLQKRVAGTPATPGSLVLPYSYTAGSVWHIHIQQIGQTLRGRGWPDTLTEPALWDVEVTDTSLTAGGAVGCRSIAETGNTNTLPVNVQFASFSAVGLLAGSATSTAGSYVRLSLTFTATQPLHTLQIANPGDAVASATTVLVDDIQHEPGGSASTFTSSGPVVYGVWRGNTERWPSEWAPDTEGFLGWAATVGVDAFAAFNKITLYTEIRNAIMAKQPARYWPLSEGSGSTTFGDVSGANGPSMTILNAKAGAGTIAAGAATNTPGDVGGSGVSCNTGTTTTNVPASTLYAIGFTQYATWSVSWVMAHTTLTNTGGLIPQYALGMDLSDNLASGLTGAASVRVTGIDGTPNKLRFVWTPLSTGGSTTIDVTDSWADGLPHLFTVVCDTRSTAPFTFTVYVYVDGVLVNTPSATAWVVSGVPSHVAFIELGGYISPATLVAAPAIPGGVYSHLAMWRRALTADEVADLAYALTGYDGEYSGARIFRYLSYGWVGLTSIDAGESIMGVSNLTANTALLSGCQAVTTTENGNFWVDARGYTRFAARTVNYLNVTSMYTFGENTAGGEFPYQPGIKFDFDPTLVYDTVQIVNYQGPTVTATDQAGTRRYFPSVFSRNVNVSNPFEVVDAATYFLAEYGAPRQRVESIVLDPSSYQLLWPVILSLEIGTRVTVKRRAKAANGGVGLTMSQDYFVQMISHDGLNMDPAAGRWLVTLWLSPVDLSQVGILDDATYGLLDSTMILAY